MGVGVVLQKVWALCFYMLPVVMRFTSAGACKCIPWEVHTRVLISVSLVCGRGKK